MQKIKNFNNILLIAGDGSRFKERGYSVPKPLLPIKKIPMMIKASSVFNFKDRVIIVSRKKHYAEFKIREIFKKNLKLFKILKLKRKTDGQATSCYRAVKNIKNKKKIFVISSDAYFEYDYKKLKQLISKNYLIILVHSHKLKEKNKNYNKLGYVKYLHGKIHSISCKKTISKKPWKDLIIIGSFIFPNAKIFQKYYKIIKKKKIKINNEYYIDTICDEMIKSNEKVATLKVKNYRDYGDPLSYEKNKNL